jgi:hypothetical protein
MGYLIATSHGDVKSGCRLIKSVQQSDKSGSIQISISFVKTLSKTHMI